MEKTEKWELLKMAVEAARVKVGNGMSVYDVSSEIPYDRGDFTDEEIEEAIRLVGPLPLNAFGMDAGGEFQLHYRDSDAPEKGVDAVTLCNEKCRALEGGNHNCRVVHDGNLLLVADRFLKRKATYEELRTAVNTEKYGSPSGKMYRHPVFGDIRVVGGYPDKDIWCWNKREDWSATDCSKISGDELRKLPVVGRRVSPKMGNPFFVRRSD